MKKRFIKKISGVIALFMIFVSICACNEENNNVKSAKEGTVYTKSLGSKGNSGNVALEAGDTYAVISVEKFGDIKIKLFPEAAPYGVQNFIDLANSGYFSGKNIHRVVSDFMLQGGSLNGNGTGGTAADGGEFYTEINADMRHFYGALCYANAGGKNSCQFYIVNNKTPQSVDDAMYDQYISTYTEYKNMYLEESKKYDNNSYGYMFYSSQAENFANSIKGWEYVKGKNLSDEVKNKYSEVGGVPFLDGCYTVFGQTVEGFDVIDAISAVEVTDNGNNEVSLPLDDIIISSVTIGTV